MTSPRSAAAPAWSVRLTGAALAVAVVAAYATSLANGFVFDDQPGIVRNETIRHLTDWRAVLSPPLKNAGAGGRPLVNLTLALNHALGGLDPRGYHLANLGIHLVAALVLFGLLRRTLARPAAGSGPAGVALPLAAGAALLWALHPLVTESVTFAIQRNESLMGLFYLLTLYAFARAADAPAPAAARWRRAMVAACLLGMLTKEVMVTAPVIVWLYDRTFVSGTLGAAWRRHGRWHLVLAATWLPLIWLVWRGAERGGTVGFGLGVTPWHYLLTQCRAIVHYLGLAVWPHPLVADYGDAIVTSLRAVLPQASLLAGLAAATLLALWRRPVLGFAGAWFLVILAPSSSVVPLTTQTMAEHRMYLPLIAVVTAGVLALHRLAGRRSLPALLALAVAFGGLTARRNAAYHDEITFWRENIAALPGNFRSHNDLAIALGAAGDYAGAVEQFQAALQIRPDNADAHYNLGTIFANLGRDAEAIREFNETLRLSPASADAQVNLGNVLLRARHPAEALARFDAALRLKPDLVAAHMGRGNACLHLDRLTDAMDAYRAALRLDPKHVSAYYNLGNAYLHAGRYAEAIASYDAALRLDPQLDVARQNREIARRRAAGTPAAPPNPD
ncbi:MAG TPA: tetratricopeptide repeat protein [Opitutaceae bacterium]|nr:tetratricopeptide repeat protein [Opitutaceae bacterium]